MNRHNSLNLIAPHGDKLIDLNSFYAEYNDYLPRFEILASTLADIECITTGIYSPLTGFLSEKEYNSVVNDMRLENGLPWSVPVTLTLSDDEIKALSSHNAVVLTWRNQPIVQLEIQEIYKPNKQLEAEKVYGTTDTAHPGVKKLLESGDNYVGGKISLINEVTHNQFKQYHLTPQQTREHFAKQGWQTIAAFQTRNPIHRAHEYLQKTALEMVDGLFINPLVGATKHDDVPADVRMHTYEVILKEYYPQQRVLLGVFPAAMRYAGPREAIMHAIARKNYGCTHFIVGRDHAGVGDYYGTYDAQQIFDAFTPDEIGITPLKFEHAFYCSRCGQMVTSKTCPHDKKYHTHLSGTKVRTMLTNGEMPPAEFTRPEVAKILINAYQEKKQDA